MRPQACSPLARARGVTVLRTDDPQRVLLRVTHTYENKRLLEGIVSRAKLAAALKAELIRFFSTEFDPQHWDVQGDPEPDDDHAQTQDIVLNHPWVASSR